MTQTDAKTDRFAHAGGDAVIASLTGVGPALAGTGIFGDKPSKAVNGAPRVVSCDASAVGPALPTRAAVEASWVSESAVPSQEVTA